MTTRQQLKHYQRRSHSQQHESSSAWHSALVPSCPAVRHIHSYQVTWSRRRWLAEARRPGRSVSMSTCLDVAEMPGPLHTTSCIFMTRINSQSRRQKHLTSAHLLSRLRCSKKKTLSSRTRTLSAKTRNPKTKSTTPQLIGWKKIINHLHLFY